METISLLEARKTFTKIIGRAAYGHHRYVLERHGEPMAAIVSMEDLRLLEALEERHDLEAARLALAEPGENVSLEDAKRELGL